MEYYMRARTSLEKSYNVLLKQKKLEEAQKNPMNSKL